MPIQKGIIDVLLARNICILTFFLALLCYVPVVTEGQMVSETVRFTTEDGIELVGRIDRIQSELMVRGMILAPGGFSWLESDPFFDRIPTILASKGLAVLSMTPRRMIQATWKNSTFEDTAKDIRAAVEFMKGRGVTSVYLGGHSNGASEAIYYAGQMKDPPIRALVVYATGPGVFRGSLIRLVGEQEYSRIVGEAKDLVSRGRGDETVYTGRMTSDMRSIPFSARTLLSWAGPDSKGSPVQNIRSVAVPVLVLVHEKDPLPSLNRWVWGNATASRKADFKLYTVGTSGNPHWFRGFEEQAVQDTADWLNSLPTTTSTTSARVTQTVTTTGGATRSGTSSVTSTTILSTSPPQQSTPPSSEGMLMIVAVVLVVSFAVSLTIHRLRHKPSKKR